MIGNKGGIVVLSANEEDSAQQAASHIKNAGLVAFPTESVYGLGADATNSSALASIYKAKGRPQVRFIPFKYQDNPLITHVSSLEMASDFKIVIPSIYDEIISAFWPGPLTILVPRPSSIPSIVAAGSDVMSLRIPNHEFALAFIAVSLTF
jgi:L-threonylcarbamoyladenylate synthase